MKMETFIPNEDIIKKITKRMQLNIIKWLSALLVLDILIIFLVIFLNCSLVFFSIVLLIVFPLICLIVYEMYKEKICDMNISFYILGSAVYCYENSKKIIYNPVLSLPHHNTTLGSISNLFSSYIPSLYCEKTKNLTDVLSDECKRIFIKKIIKQSKRYTAFAIESIDNYGSLQKNCIKVYKIYDNYDELIRLLIDKIY